MQCVAAVAGEAAQQVFSVVVAGPGPDCFKPNANIATGDGASLTSEQKTKEDQAKKQAKDKIDFETMTADQLQELADELGVTVDDLRAAIQEAKNAIDNAVPVSDADWAKAPPSCANAVACTVQDKATGSLAILVKESEYQRSVAELAEDFIEEGAHVLFTAAGNLSASEQHDVIWCDWVVSNCCHRQDCGDQDRFCELGNCYDTCSPGAALLSALQSCTTGETAVDQIRLPTNGCPGPACDPADLDDIHSLSWANCFNNKSYGNPGEPASMACAAVKCAGDQYAAAGTGGCHCTSRTGGSGSQPSYNTCGTLLCADGVPAATGGGCRCGGVGMDALNRGPIPPQYGPRTIF